MGSQERFMGPLVRFDGCGPEKPYRGMSMEGMIATYYSRARVWRRGAEIARPILDGIYNSPPA